MIKNMNNEQFKIIKILFIVGLFIFMILWNYISIITAVAFILGEVVSTINFYMLSFFIKKYMERKSIFTILTYVIRIFIVAIITLLFIDDIYSVLSYVMGIQLFYIVLVVNKVSWKGSD